MASKEIAGVKISELDPGLSSNFDGEALLIVTGSEKDEAGNAIHKSVKMDLADDTDTGDKANPFFGLAAIQKLKEIAKKESDAYTDEELLKYVQKDGDKVLSTNDFTDALKEKLESIDLNNPVINVAAFNKKEFTIIDGKVYLAERGINEDRLNLDSDHRFVTDAQIELWNSKQNALNDAQINAANSGITSAKVAQYDGYASSKQNALTAKQLTIVNLDPDQIHFDQWNAHVANSDIHVTLADKSNWNNKVTDIHPGDGVTIVETPGTVKDYTINIDTSGIVINGGTIQIPIGTIIPFMGAGVPDGFLKCDGSSYSRITYSELFAVIGTRYGSTSSSTFKVPDLSDSRYIVGVGSFPAGEQKISPVLPNHIHGGTHGHGAGTHTHGVSVGSTSLNHSHTITTNNLSGSISDSHVNTTETIKVAEDPTGEPVFKAVSLTSETKSVTISTGRTEITNQSVPTKSVTSEQSGGTVADYTGNTLGVVKSGNIYSGSDNIYTGADDQIVPRSMPVVFYIKAKKSSSDITVDSALSTTSTNPVQNKIITNALNNKMALYPNSIEIIGSSAGYIDFHYNGNTTKDYTSRLAEEAEGILRIRSNIGSAGNAGGTIRTTKDPIASDDLTRKGYVDAQITAATNASSSLGTRVTNLENTRVLRAGDTMTGTLKFGSTPAVTTAAICRTVDDSGLWICGGKGSAYGASLFLGGKDLTGYKVADSFELRLSDGKTLVGKNDGTLAWNGNNIVRKVKVNGSTKSAGIDGIVDLSTLVSSVTLNGSAVSISNGSINLGNLVSSIKINGSTKTPTSGVVDLSTLVSSVTLNGSAVSISNGSINLGNLVSSIKINGSTKTPTSGVVDLSTLVSSITINGSSKTITNGAVDLGSYMVPNPNHIELAGSTYPHGGYIDFHYNAETTKDFTSRIIEGAEGILTIYSHIGSEGRTGGTIRTSKNPSNNDDLTRKKYVDDSIDAATNNSSALGQRISTLEGNRVLRAGDTMSGQLKFSVGSDAVSIGRSDDAQGTWITGGTTNSKGGSLYLGGINNATANFADVFILRTSGNKALKGTNDGNLNWSGGTITSTNFNGTATRAKWADLAEYYLMDEVYPVGTILQFGGSAEMTAAFDFVSGVVSERPALVMNTEFEKYHNAQPVALIGRVKVRVEGRVKKFDLIGLHPDKPGIAIKVTNRNIAIGTVLKGKNSSGEGLVLVSLKSNI